MMISRSAAQRRPRRAMDGFTLIEMLVVLAIVVIIALFAVPTLGNFKRNNEVITAANNLATSMNIARTEAMRSGEPTAVIPVVAGTAGWAKGWTATNTSSNALLDSKGPITPSGTSDVTEDTSSASDNNLSGTGIAFTSNGYAMVYGAKGGFVGTDANTITFTSGQRRRRVIVNPSGSVTVCDPDAVKGYNTVCP